MNYPVLYIIYMIHTYGTKLFLPPDFYTIYVQDTAEIHSKFSVTVRVVHPRRTKTSISKEQNEKITVVMALGPVRLSLRIATTAST